MRKIYKIYILVFISCVLLFYCFLIIPDLLFQLELNETGLTTQGTVLATQQSWGVCLVDYHYDIEGQTKSFSTWQNVPCTGKLYHNIVVGSPVTVRYLPSKPAASDLAGNALIWWIDIVRAVAIVGCILGFIIYLRQALIVGEQFTVKTVMIGGMALAFSGMSMLLAVGGIQALEFAPGVIVCSTLLGSITMVGVRIKRKNGERYINWLEKR